MNILEPLLTLKEAAHYLSVSPNILMVKMLRGEVPVVGIGFYCGFRKSALDSYLRRVQGEYNDNE